MTSSERPLSHRGNKENVNVSSILEEENTQLKKQLRQTDNELKKTKAVLEQKVEQLTAQIQEAAEREKNLKRMNETIMGAINDLNAKSDNPIINKAVKELELATEQHNKEMQEYRQRTSELIKNLEQENRKLKEDNADNENLIKEMKLQFEKNHLHYNSTFNEIENEKSNLEMVIRRFEEEKRQQKDIMEYEIQLRISELKSNQERLKDEHRKEVEKISREYDKSLKDLRAIYEDEKKISEARLQKTQELLKKTNEESESGAIVIEMQNQHQKEIESLNKIMSEIRSHHLAEVQELKQQKDEALEKAERAENNLKKLKVALRNSQTLQEQNTKILKQRMDKAQNVMEQGESLVEENKKYKQKIIELRGQIKKLEVSEKKLKDLILDKEIKIDEERMEFKKMLNSEQKMLAQSVQEPHLGHSTSHSKVLTKSMLQNAVDDPDICNTSSMKSQQFLALMNSNQQRLNNQPSQKNLSSASLTPVKSPNTESQTNLAKSSEKLVEKGLHKVLSHEKEAFTTNKKDPKSHQNLSGSALSNMKQRIVQKSSAIKGQPQQNNQNNKTFDIDSLPINYNDFMKKTERSRIKTFNTDEDLCEDFADPLLMNLEMEPSQFGTSQFANPQLEAQSQYNLFNIAQVEQEEVPEREFTDESMEIHRPKSQKKDRNVNRYNNDSTNFENNNNVQYSLDMMLSSKVKTSRRAQMSNQISNQMSSQLSNIQLEEKKGESRHKIEERLKGLEEKLKEMEIKNQGLKVEKDKVQIEFERLLSELKQAKADTSVLEGERKDEKETALKNEIKFLINKLLKVKNKLEKQNEELNATKLQNVSTMNQSVMNNSIMLPQSLCSSIANYGSIIQTSQKTPTDMMQNYMSIQAQYQANNNKSYSELERFETPGKTSLGLAIENFARNLRSKSNMRYDHSRASQPLSSASSTTTNSSVVSQRAKTPLIDRNEDPRAALGMLMGKDILRDNLAQNYQNLSRKSYK